MKLIEPLISKFEVEHSLTRTLVVNFLQKLNSTPSGIGLGFP